MTRISPTGSGATGSGSTFTLALVAGLVRAIRKFVIALRNRGAIQRLHALDDRMLKDIGISRSDIDGVLVLPLSEDPSAHLRRHADTDHASLRGIPAERSMLRSRTALPDLTGATARA